MRRRPPRSVQGRAIIGLVALYALWLHAFLGTLSPVMPALPGPTLCAEHTAGAPTDETAPCHQHACCLAAQAAVLGPAPLAYAALVWPAVAGAPLVRRITGAIGARAPPDPAIGPRGPPTV